MELPLWIAESDPEWGHMQEADVSRALAAGLTFRPLSETVGDTLAWARTQGRLERCASACSPRASASFWPSGISLASPPMDGYPFVHREHVRFRDLDAMGHINNAVFATYIEQARVEYLASLSVLDGPVYDQGAESMILARIEIDFRAPGQRGARHGRHRRPPRVGRQEELHARLPARAGRRAARRGHHRARLVRLRARPVAARCPTTGATRSQRPGQ